MSKRLLAIVTACLALSACASASGDYPSLAIRDVERAQGQFEPVAVPQLDVPEVSTAAVPGFAAALASAREANGAFLAALPATRRAVSAGRGRGIESDARASALVAIAVLESRHSDTLIALAHLDTLLVAAEVAAEPLGALGAAHAEAQELADAQEAALDPLRDQLR